MAIIKDLVNRVSFEAVWAEISAAASDVSAYQNEFRQIFEDFQKTQPEENRNHMTVWLKMEEDPFAEFSFGDAPEEDSDSDEPQKYLQVFAYVPDDPESYAIGVKPTEQIMGYDVAAETLETYSPEKIVAYCMMEITYSSSVASSAYSSAMDRAGGGIYAAQACMEGDMQDISIEQLREEMGIGAEKEDYKSKYGFLF